MNASTKKIGKEKYEEVMELFEKGLIMSDGSYYFDKQCGRHKYLFTNKSEDIKNIFIKYLALLGVKCSVYKRETENKPIWKVAIVNKFEVDKLHKLIGDKENIV